MLKLKISISGIDQFRSKSTVANQGFHKGIKLGEHLKIKDDVLLQD